MTYILCSVAMNSKIVPTKVLYCLRQEFDNKSKFYGILYAFYGIKVVKILEVFKQEDPTDLGFKYSGMIELSGFWSLEKDK